MEGCPLVKYLRQSELRKREEALKIQSLDSQEGKGAHPVDESIPPPLSRTTANLFQNNHLIILEYLVLYGTNQNQINMGQRGKPCHLL